MSTHRLVSSLFTLVLTAALALLVIALAGEQGDGGPDQVTDANALLVTSRTGLRVCVESLDSGIEPAIVRDRVHAGLARISRHPDFAAAGLGRRPVDVHEGCSAAPTIDQPGYRSSSRLGAPVAVEKASPYRLMVFVAPAGRMAAAFQDRDPALTAQEVICGAGTCPVVTMAAYFSPASLFDAEAVDRALTEGVGLREVRRP